MKILIIEDDFEGIKTNFEAINIIYFDNNLEFENIAYSQDLDNCNIDDYDLIMVDIDLSDNSDKDGLAVIKEIKEHDIDKPVIIITGSSNITNSYNVPIIIKPLKFKIVYEVMKSLLNLN